MKTARMFPRFFRAALVCLTPLLLLGCGDDGSDGGSNHAAANASPEQLARGKYLATAADCAACHTASGGASFAGGVPLDTPFGTIHGTNITPDPDTGIGRWSSDDFYKAVTAGKAPGGHYLYPAMPYTSYRAMTRADADAIYAYLMHLQPVKQANKKNDLGFPYNLRFGLAFWNVLFLKDELPAVSPGQSAQWARGRYLANVMGHCAECHTPRGKLGQLDLGQMYAGYALGRFLSPDITPKGLASRGWTAEDLQTFFHVGIAPQGSAFGDMYPAVHLSTSHLNDADLKALTVYLLGDQPPPAQPFKAAASADSAKLEPGRRIYLNVCAGCHAVGGEGKPHTAVAMLGNSTVRADNPHNLIVSILDGLPEQQFSGLENMQPMPGFAQRLNDGEIADLANYLRAAWGGQPADITPQKVAALRNQ